MQMGVFKASGRKRRLFRMSPIHHHFELVGWPETTVIIRFWLIAGDLRRRRRWRSSSATSPASREASVAEPRRARARAGRHRRASVVRALRRHGLRRSIGQPTIASTTPSARAGRVARRRAVDAAPRRLDGDAGRARRPRVARARRARRRTRLIATAPAARRAAGAARSSSPTMGAAAPPPRRPAADARRSPAPTARRPRRC